MEILEGKMNFKGKNNPNFGKKWSKDMKLRLSKKFKGKHFSKETEFKKGKIPYNKGKNLSVSTKEKIKQSRIKNWKNDKYKKYHLKQLIKGFKAYLKNKKKLYKKCLFCGKKFLAGYVTNKTAQKRRFCSRKCAYDWSPLDKQRREKLRKVCTHQIIEHHIDVNPKNNNIENKLKIDASKHRQLHEFGYHYLVLTGQIKQYIKWFDKKYGLK